MIDYDMGPNEVRNLAAAIVYQAIDDWIQMIRGGKTSSFKGGNKSYDDIRVFFGIGLGADLCDYLEIDSDAVQSVLDTYLQQYEDYGLLPRRIPRQAFKPTNVQKF